MKKIFSVVFAVLILISIFWWYWVNLPIDSKIKLNKQVFVIKRGESIDSIGNRLAQADLIKSQLAFKISIYFQGLSKNIQAGSFHLSRSMSLKELCQNLTKGSLDFWLTIPEGLRVEEIAERIGKIKRDHNQKFDKNQFIKLAQDYEGYLFPDTYLIPYSVEAGKIIDILRRNFEEKYQSLDVNHTKLTKKELVILASLIEREVKFDQDRPIVAGIILKRLENDWPLQIDATIQYLLGYQSDQDRWWKKNLTKQDLQANSSFNTYKNLGLPPRPISNPGLASLKAAAKPQTTNYWFYLSDLSGKIYFAETIEEHQQNIEKHLTN